MWGSGAEPAPGEVETISLKNTEAGGHPVGLQRGNERRGGVLRRKSWGAWLLHVVVFALMMIQPRAAGISLAALASPKLGVEPEALWRKRRPAGGLCSRMVVAYAGEVVQPKAVPTFDEDGVRWSQVNGWKVAVAESAATVVERCFVYPLDKLRTRLQIDPTKHASLMTQAVVVTRKTWMEGWRPGANEARVGLVGAVQGLTGGVKGFYCGFMFSALVQIPSNVLYICAYQYTKEKLDGNFGLGKISDGSPMAPLLAATFSELVSAIFDVPHDVIVQRVQVQHAKLPFTRSWRVPSRGVAVFQEVVRTVGSKGLYTGIRAHLLTFLPWSATWWTSYEMGKVVFARMARPLNVSDTAVHMAAGVVAGLLAATVSNPIDVIKTRLQTDPSLQGQALVKVARDMLRREGGQALFKGLAVAIAFDVIVSGVGGVRYDWVMKFALKPESSDEAANDSRESRTALVSPA